MAEPSKADIDRLLMDRFPKFVLVQLAAQTSAALYNGKEAAPDFSKELAQFDAARSELEALPREELKALVAVSKAREVAAKEAARFYNQPKATADFVYWAAVEYWTLDEAVALLLGRDPHAVNPETLQRELTQNTGFLKMVKPPDRAAFHQTYERLRTRIARAEGLNVERLKPTELVAWVVRTQAVEMPPQLALLVSAGSIEPVRTDSSIPTDSTTSKAPPRIGTPKVWDEARLDELKLYRLQKGTKAAAEHFGISATRVRELLPGGMKSTTSPAPFKSFVHRMK